MNKVKIQARSIFLQGILLKDIKNLPIYFQKWKKHFLNFKFYNLKNKLDKISMCINFVNNNKNIDQIIIGVQSINELKQILSYKKRKKILLPENFFSSKINLINPIKWPQKK